MLSYSIYPPIQAGGAELIVSYLAEGLVARGHRVTVASTCGPQMEPYPDEMRNGVDVLRFFPRNRYWLFQREGRGGLDKLRWHAQDAWNRAAARRLQGILQDRRPDVFHGHGVEGFSPAIWGAARARSVPIVHTAHDYYLVCPRALLLTRDLKICSNPSIACRARASWYLRCARMVDVFCSPSRFLLDVHARAGLRVARQVVVPNGIPSVARAAARRPRRAGEPLRLLYAGRLAPEKGLRVVLEAMLRIPASLPVELVIAGKGALEAEAGAAAARDPRITFAGYLSGEQKDRAFARADCLLLPSLWYENAPVVILEAAAYRLPVIASRLGAIPEFVDDGVNGLLFTAGDPAALAAQITRLAGDPGLCAALGDGGAPLIARHSVARMVDAYLEQYLSLVHERPARAPAGRAGA